MIFGKRQYSLTKSSHVLRTSYKWYQKKGDTLSASLKSELEKKLTALEEAIQRKDRTTADSLAHEVEGFDRQHFKKSFFEYAFELVIALVLALIVATIVRQMWFELYEIPSGSMRPTFREQDHLTVSKLPFGINVPLETTHFYFDPNLVQRDSVVIFSGDHIPIIDQNTTYFGILPYKKRYIKRLIGKPGDTLYFYGGDIYGIDKEGNSIPDFVNSPWEKGIEHIPFLRFEGLLSATSSDKILFSQMHMPIGRLILSPTGALVGEVHNGKEWIRDQADAQKKPHDKVETYGDLWGIRNFGMAQLLTREQLQKMGTDLEGIGEGVLYLEIRHDPSLTYPKPQLRQEKRGLSISLNPYKTIIPLQQKDLDALMSHMYTARFVVENGHARRYSMEETNPGSGYAPLFPGVPDGTYEFYYGKAEKVGWGGMTTPLPDNHPLYSHDPANVQKLYNLGIEMDLVFAPHEGQTYFPQRYAYFRNGDLYLLGAPLLKKDDPALVAFNEREEKNEQSSSVNRPYIAFKDYGPPLTKEGQIDKDFIKAFGVKVPEGHYLVLGDNHAMSSDSRVFGFVPEQNLQGAPSLIIWPPGDRLGSPMQKPYPIINLPRIVVWGTVLLIILLWYLFSRWRSTQRVLKQGF